MPPGPAIRCSTNRFRHRPTACGVECNRAATSLLDRTRRGGGGNTKDTLAGEAPKPRKATKCFAAEMNC